MIVEVPGVGNVEFPDGTPNEVIEKALSAYRDPRAERMAAAKAGTLQVSPESAAAAEGLNAQAMKDMEASAYQPSQLSSFLTGAAQGGTFGASDEIIAGLHALSPNDTYDEALKRTRGLLDASRRDHPVAAYGGEITGAMAVPVGAAGTTGRLPLRMAKSAASGGGLSAGYSFLAGEGGLENRVDNAVEGAKWGAGIGAAVPVAGHMLQRVLDRSAANKAIKSAAKGAPSSEELRAAGNAAYKAIDDANVQIKPQAFDDTRARIVDALRKNTGFDELPGPGSLTPNSARTMQIMDAAGDRMAADPTAALPFSSLDQMRRQAGAAAGNVTNKTDAKAGMTIIEGLDDFVNRLDPADVVSGDVDALKTMVPLARDTWGKLSRSELVDTAIKAGNENYLSGASSGIRNQFKKILSNPKLSRGFSEGERAAMSRVVNGSAPEQLLTLLGGGLGQLTQIGTGAGLGLVGGPVGSAIGAGIGTAAAAATRKAAGAVTNRNAEIARAIVANGTLKSLPKANPQIRAVIEQLMRQGTAAALPK